MWRCECFSSCWNVDRRRRQRLKWRASHSLTHTLWIPVGFFFSSFFFFLWLHHSLARSSFNFIYFFCVYIYIFCSTNFLYIKGFFLLVFRSLRNFLDGVNFTGNNFCRCALETMFSRHVVFFIFSRFGKINNIVGISHQTHAATQTHTQHIALWRKWEHHWRHVVFTTIERRMHTSLGTQNGRRKEDFFFIIWAHKKNECEGANERTGV